MSFLRFRSGDTQAVSKQETDKAARKPRQADALPARARGGQKSSPPKLPEGKTPRKNRNDRNKKGGRTAGSNDDDDDGLFERIKAKKRRVRTVASALKDVNRRSYGGLHESFVHEVLIEAYQRREKAGTASAQLATVIPYDLQKELFEKFERSSSVKDPVLDVSEKLEDERKKGPVEAALKTDQPTVETPTGSETSAVEAQEGALVLKDQGSTVHRPWWSWPYRAAAGIVVRKEEEKEVLPTESSGSEIIIPDPGIGGSASASVSSEGEESADNYARLIYVIERAEQVRDVESARDFVENTGVRSLVAAARQIDGARGASAVTSLSNIAWLLPSARTDILMADSSSILSTVMSALGAPLTVYNRLFGGLEPDEGFKVEARVSAAHLIGSLGLIPGEVGDRERTRLGSNARLITRLENLAEGAKNGHTEAAARAARRALAILGVNKWRPKVPGQRGLRILSIDGGGTRALMTFEMLKHLKQITGCEVHEMFDIIGGTSTGAIIAGALGVMKKPVEEVEALYRELISKIFAKHPLNSSKMLFTRAQYDTSVFEKLLQRECGDRRLLDSTTDVSAPKVFAVSAVLTPQRSVLTHVFRNYTYPVDGQGSRYYGNADVPLWLALRCSSAAPTFFTEMRVNGEVHADGAIIANNPAAVALHESHSIYPGVPVELLVSCGNGILDSNGVESLPKPGDKSPAIGWTALLGSIITSATSTEQAHHALEDLMPPEKYFRFNPPTKCTNIDETDPGRLAFWVRDAKRYIHDERVHERFERVAQILRPRKPLGPVEKVREAIRQEVRHLEELERCG